MKNIYIFILILIISFDVSQAQLATDSWGFGFGGRYPRYLSANIDALNSNYGGYLSVQRTFSEHFALRLKGGYSHLEGEWIDQTPAYVTQSTNLITGDLDFMYYLIPCEPVSPYIFAGAGGNYRMLTNKATASVEDNAFGSQYNLGGGVEWRIGDEWKFVSEFGFHSTGNSELDGTINNIELNPRDTYWGISLGLNYIFAKGDPSPMCELAPGLTVEMKDMTDYNKIEDMIKRHIPKEIIKEVVVDKYIYAITDDRIVLIGVNFAFDKSDLLPESYSVLDKGVKLLKDNPNVNVEIEGYTDYIGTAEYNMQLSIERAIRVKEYLVSQGIADSRLSTVGYGQGNPVASNETEEGRTMNRRIVFRIIR